MVHAWARRGGTCYVVVGRVNNGIDLSLVVVGIERKIRLLAASFISTRAVLVYRASRTVGLSTSTDTLLRCVCRLSMKFLRLPVRQSSNSI